MLVNPMPPTAPPGSAPPSSAPPSSAQRALRQQLREIDEPRVLQAMLGVPRHAFVPIDLQGAAYEDSPLPIGHGQTISQPLMVARLLVHARLQSHHSVLDVGSGSGYQAALLRQLVAKVVSVEIVPELVLTARRNLASVGLTDVAVIEGNGREGYPQDAPYDAILVAAASADVPDALLAQLAPGGRLLLPLGPPEQQVLQCWTRTAGGFEQRALDRCRFVPLVS
jgi:protein-L-isoaspartate(D-aspartate) O-methyltransferase